jgi:hypothetical protein
VTATYIPADLRRRVRQQAGDRCGYCRSPQYLVLGPLEIEHLIPLSAGGTSVEENLWLSCRMCNCFKAGQTDGLDPASQQRVPLFDPRRQHWMDHFNWSNDGTHVTGTTPIGRATVLALQINNPIAVTVRRIWVSAGWHPPKDE